MKPHYVRSRAFVVSNIFISHLSHRANLFFLFLPLGRAGASHTTDDAVSNGRFCRNRTHTCAYVVSNARARFHLFDVSPADRVLPPHARRIRCTHAARRTCYLQSSVAFACIWSSNRVATRMQGAQRERIPNRPRHTSNAPTHV